MVVTLLGFLLSVIMAVIVGVMFFALMGLTGIAAAIVVTWIGFVMCAVGGVGMIVLTYMLDLGSFIFSSEKFS